jgi:hypothetical protein
MDSLKKEFVNANKGRIPPDQMFRELCKENVYLWADYIANGPSHEVELEELSNMVNTDGEPMSFTNIYFKIRHPADLQKKLNKIKDFTFDPDAKTWQWLGRGRGKNKGRVFKGGVTIEGDHLIGETNSLERALELKYLIINKLNDSVTYHELESSAVPKVSLDELKRFEEEQRKINSTPEAQEMIKQQMDEYYLNEWISAKIPALNNKTPRQMIKTAEGCAKVEELLQYMEKRNNTLPDHMYRFDFNRLRRKLGLPVK